MWSERKHGLSAKQVSVSAYVESSKNLKDLKDGNKKSGAETRISEGLWSPSPSPAETRLQSPSTSSWSTPNFLKNMKAKTKSHWDSNSGPRCQILVPELLDDVSRSILTI